MNTGLLSLLFLMLPITLEQPPESLTVTVPDYTIQELGGLHYITLPGGEILMMDGCPRMPFYPVTVNYPAGYHVQEVTLAEKSGRRTETGIRLPALTITLDTLETAEPPRAAETEGPYPGRDFDWSIWHGTAGSTDLHLAVYPFQFNSATTELTYHQRFRFRIRYARTTLRPVRVLPTQAAYPPGTPVLVNLELTNSGPAQDISISAVVSGAVTATLPERGFRVLTGDTLLPLEWLPDHQAYGDCVIRLTIRDGNGNTIGTSSTMVRLGIPAGEISSFTAEPQFFRIGDTVRLNLQFRNTGTCPISGSCAFRITRDGTAIFDTSCAYSDLTPGRSADFSTHWQTAGAIQGALYHALAYVEYGGMTTPTQHVELSTNRPPAPSFSFEPAEVQPGTSVLFDASASSDPDGSINEFRWEFGDGGTASGVRASHTYQLPGSYPVKLTATDNEGRTAAATATVTVQE